MRDRLLRLLAAGVFASVLALDLSHPAAQAPTDVDAGAHDDGQARLRRRAVARRQRVAFVVGEAVMEGEKSEWLSQLHLAAAGRIGEPPVDARRQVGDLAAVVARRQVARVHLVAQRQGQRLADQPGGRRSRDDHRREGRGRARSSGRRTASRLRFVMRDPKSDDEEKADKEKRDWRTSTRT